MSSPANESVVSLAVVGAGFIGARHARMVAAVPGCRLAGLADPSDAGARLAAELGVACYASHAGLFGRDDVDGVIVADRAVGAHAHELIIGPTQQQRVRLRMLCHSTAAWCWWTQFRSLAARSSERTRVDCRQMTRRAH